jgi:peptidoglycan biosynthesis protein MviN/MurJ (putative lipid II flippase)
MLMALNGFAVLLGLAVNAISAAAFGISNSKDALEAALSIPRQLLSSLGVGSLGGSSLYVLAREEEESHEERKSLLMTVFWVQTLYSAVLVAGVLFLKVWFAERAATGYADAERRLLVRALTVTSVLLLLQPAQDLFSTGLLAVRRFGFSQLAIILQRFVTVLALLLVPQFGAIAYPAGIVAGTCCGVMVAWYGARHEGLVAWSMPRLRSPRFRQVVRLSVPWMLAAPVLNAAGLVLIPMLLHMGSGAMATYAYANGLYAILIAVVFTPVMDVLAPSLARDAGIHSREGTALSEAVQLASLTKGLRVAIVVGGGATIFAVCGSGALTRLLLARGALRPADAIHIADLFALSALGYVGHSLTVFLGRYFQAQLRIWPHIAAQAASPAVVLVVVYLLGDTFGVDAVGVGLALSAFASALIAIGFAANISKRGLSVFDQKCRLTTLGYLVISALGWWCLRPFSLRPVGDIAVIATLAVLVVAITLRTSRHLGLHEFEALASGVRSRVSGLLR